MGHSDLRRGRVSLAGQVYLITTRTHERIPHFHDLYIARAVIGEMRRIDTSGRVQSLAWVLMPDHLHWLLALSCTAVLADIMRIFKGRAAHAVNRLRGTHGRLWQPAYHDHAVRNEDLLLPTTRYIVANPIRAGLCTHLGDYPHWDVGATSVAICL